MSKANPQRQQQPDFGAYLPTPEEIAEMCEEIRAGRTRPQQVHSLGKKCLEVDQGGIEVTQVAAPRFQVGCNRGWMQ